MRIPLTMLGGLVGYFVWATNFADTTSRIL
jgi:hypothetical protein